MKPYFETDNGKLYHGDHVDILPGLNIKIDLTVTSPPYDKLRSYKGFVFDYKKTSPELFKISKPGATIVWVVADQTINGSETGTSFKQALFFMETGFNLHDTMIYKSEKPPLTHNRYEQSFEYMFIFSNGPPKTFNPILKKNKYYGDNSLRNGSWASGKDNSAIRQREGFKAVKKYGIKNNIWEYKTGGSQTSKDKIAFDHPAIFPEMLAQDHILSWSNENDIVLDPMCGSGTVAKMCEVNNRKWIGIEISEEYCEIVAKRIERETKQLKLFK